MVHRCCAFPFALAGFFLSILVCQASHVETLNIDRQAQMNNLRFIVKKETMLMSVKFGANLVNISIVTSHINSSLPCIMPSVYRNTTIS